MTTTSHRKPIAFKKPAAIKKSTRIKLPVALPEPSLTMDQDEEWCVVEIEGEWRQVRFHDYDELYKVQGLYEKIIYDVLKCDSPRVICETLSRELSQTDHQCGELRVLDLGAGNGIVAEELQKLGAKHIVGVDIIPEAEQASNRDRPGVYNDYQVVDLTRLSTQQHEDLETHKFNALTCVAALGYGDIPTRAFATAYNLVADGGWIAFNIKDRFLSERDRTGFAGMIHDMIDDGILDVHQKERYRHRFATNGDPLNYVAIIGIKRGDIPERLIKD